MEGGDVDVARLMIELEAEAKARRGAGEYPEDWLAPASVEPVETADREMHESLIIANQNADVTRLAEEAAAGLSGHVKHSLRAIMRRLMLFHLDQLNHYTQAVTRVLNRLNQELGEARRREAEAQDLAARYGHRLADLEEAQLPERVDRIEETLRERGLLP